MIKGKYHVLDTLKQNEYKRLDRCQRKDNEMVIAKSYIKGESQLARNEVQIYQKLKQPNLHGFP